MRAVGIVAEYNPFHNGHGLHLAEARRLSGHEAAVAVMSGNFVQRGEPAIFDKWARAELAVRCGVDLVLELPVGFAVRSAQFFAAGAIRLLAALGVVDAVCFGAEHPALDELMILAAASEDPEVLAGLRTGLAAGRTYAASLGRAMAAATGLPDEAAAAPNNILAVEYIRAIRRYAPSLCPLPTARRDAGYHDVRITGRVASATAVRRALLGGDASPAGAAVPSAVGEGLRALMEEGRGPVSWTGFGTAVLARLRLATVAELAALPDVSEGLEYRLQGAAMAAGDMEELWSELKSKRYSRTRLQRVVVHALLATAGSAVAVWDEGGPLYARVLAFNDRGRELLRVMARTAAVPVVGKVTRFLHGRDLAGGRLTPLQAMLALDVRATEVYCLGMPSARWRRGGWDFRRSPLYIPGRP